MEERTLPDIRTVDDLAGKYVLLRASLNVPLENGAVANRFRLTRAVPTIEYLRAHGARTIIVGHLGRDGESLRPVYEAMTDLVPMTWCGEVTGRPVADARAKLEDGDVLMLENLRSRREEEANDPSFVRTLASLADIYVNDAFSDSHRAHASIVGVAGKLPSYFGENFIREYEALTAAMTPQSPALFMLGGAKFETKLPLVTAFLKTYDHVFVGGALAHDIWRAQGYEVGTSLVSDIDLKDSPIITAPNLLLPVDVTVTAAGYTRVTTPDAVKPDEKIVDAGPKTVELLESHIAAARTILWNGPFGNYEDGFATVTERVAEQVARSFAHSIVGGGDTIASIESLCLENRFGFLSTAGGAMLTFLETGTLPAIDAAMK